MDVVLAMSLLTFNNINIQPVEKALIWKTYTAVEALPTTKKVKLISKNDFAKAVLDELVKSFMLYVHLVSVGSMTIHIARETWMPLLLTK